MDPKSIASANSATPANISLILSYKNLDVKGIISNSLADYGITATAAASKVFTNKRLFDGCPEIYKKPFYL